MQHTYTHLEPVNGAAVNESRSNVSNGSWRRVQWDSWPTPHAAVCDSALQTCWKRVKGLPSVSLSQLRCRSSTHICSHISCFSSTANRLGTCKQQKLTEWSVFMYWLCKIEPIWTFSVCISKILYISRSTVFVQWDIYQPFIHLSIYTAIILSIRPSCHSVVP